MKNSKGLGHFQDNPKFLRDAANYLDKHNVDVANIKEGN
jgi:hypothetical protein